MFRVRTLIAYLTLLGAFHGAFADEDPAVRRYAGYKVIRALIRGEADRAVIKSLDEASAEFELFCETLHKENPLIELSGPQLDAFKARGIPFEILVDDLENYYERQASATRSTGFFTVYHTYAEYLSFIDSIAADFPQIAQVIDLGASVQGRRLKAIHIGRGQNNPGILIQAGEHGNEILNPSIAAYIASTLAQGYFSDPQSTALVDHFDWYILPIMNPDGFVVRSRKNARGVDLNRNWGYLWGIDDVGSSPVPNASNYRGPSAFSEPETRALRDFLNAHPNIRGFADLHSAGYLLMWPWGYTLQPCADDQKFSFLAEEMFFRILQTDGTYYTTFPSSYLYLTNGDSVDYVYGQTGRAGFVCEIGYDFEMPAEEILTHCEHINAAMRFLGGWLGGCDADASNASCDGNPMGDLCQILTDGALDCNHNGMIDGCEDLPPSGDCNLNGLPDRCEDCNGNGFADSCDLQSGFSPDCDGNGLPDECESDHCAPHPDPMFFSSAPGPLGATQIGMQAAEAIDDRSGPVEYFFDYVSGLGGVDSGWQASRQYVVSNLTPNGFFNYRVKARDNALPLRHETAYSPTATAATPIETPTGLTFGPLAPASITVSAGGTFTNMGFGSTGFYFEMTPAGGSGANTWVSTPSITVTGLEPCVTYMFRVKARNFQAMETPFTPPASQKTGCKLNPGPPLDALAEDK